MSEPSMRSAWSNRWTFIMATAGSAIGLGNIWKFPYMTGVNGGSAFVLVFLGCILLVGIPLMMCEIMLGRRAQKNPADGMLHLAREASASPHWRWVGLIGVLTGVLILTFYSVIGGWVIRYILHALAGDFDGANSTIIGNMFSGMLASASSLLFWHTLFTAMTVWVVARGVNHGLEKASKILMPSLFVILLLLLIYSMVEGDFGRALDFMFTPDFSKVTPQAALSALGHAFFSLSLGMGAVMVYGSYLQRHVSIARTSFYIAIADTLVALLAGLTIYALVFKHQLDPSAGPGLIFQTLPLAFGQMWGGQVVGTLFFILVTFAAWTSSISLIEPATAWITENTSVSRSAAAYLIGFCTWLLGISVVLSFNIWQDVQIISGLGIFDTLDKLTTTILLPLGGLMMALFAGWVMRTQHVREELGLQPRTYAIWRFIIRYISPLAITVIFLSLIGLIGS
ncbi:MAG: sodium-dependent transporter [Betaproteobacteria bacterium HGW-Betaproteobacteria-1]|jgi:NSS family neurotransmitter:Na+ symporter|nr:MAG: sodium-dependent transporter [Betaproteobacteria bacterium HGW-Betaproteobacteria-1]